MTSPIRLTPEDAGASQALIDAYAESWQRINDAQLALADNPLNARKRARLNELQDMVSREINALDATAKVYVADAFPTVYEGAAQRGARAVAADALAFVQPNREAAALLADGLERQLLEATQHVDATTKSLIRKIGRDAGLKTAIDGKTAKQAATEMRRILQESGVHAVTYANGAKVGLKAYAEMAIRTSTALALNQGALQGGADAGCKFWEIFDGSSCGWSSHKDPNKAHGKVVTREQALRFPIAHPNCRRAVGPRPDLGIDEPKKTSTKTMTPDQAARLTDGNAPSVSREPSGGPESRLRAANTRAARAQERAASSVADREFAHLTPAELQRAYDAAGHAPLTPASLDSVQRYSVGLYRDWNARLRAGKTETRPIKAMRAAMRPTPRPMTVARTLDRRGLGVDALLQDDIRKQLEGLVGKQVEDRGFLSTTLNTRTAVERAGGEGKIFRGDIYMEIEVPEGTSATWAEPHSLMKGENELVLDSGTRLEITKVEIRDSFEGDVQGRFATVRARVVSDTPSLEVATEAAAVEPAVSPEVVKAAANFRRVGTPEEGDAWLAKHYDPKALTKDQKIAQGTWTSPLYTKLQEILRTGGTTLRKVMPGQGITDFPVRLGTLAEDIARAESEGYSVHTAHDLQQMLENLGPALEQHRLPEDLSLFRVVDLPDLSSADPASLIGRELEDRGYVATSTSPISAVKVTTEALSVASDTPILLEIRAPAGTPFGTPERSFGTIDHVKYGGYTQVQELVLQPSRFRVVEVVDETVDTGGYSLKNAKMKKAPSVAGRRVPVRRVVVELIP